MSGFTIGRVLLAAGWLAVMPGVMLGAESAPAATEMKQHIAKLADEEFAVREKARAALLEIGRPALPLLVEAMKSDSPEQRIRSRQLVEAIRTGILKREFEALGKLPDGEIEVEHGMWLIATILDPGLAKDAVTAKLDEMAAAVRTAAGEGVEPGKLPPGEAMALLTGVLKTQFGLHGDEVTYNSPENSSIHRVIARKRGLPILLSEIAVAVARRVELPVVGLAIPGRYMIKYDGARAPEGEERADIIVNPFEGWRVTNTRELLASIRGFDPATDLEGSLHRATLIRMLNNLASDLAGAGDVAGARTVGEYQVLLGGVLFEAR